jgi:hypothetical protein
MFEICTLQGCYAALFSDRLTLEMGRIGCPETSVTTNQCRVTSKKNCDLIYTDSEA